MFRSQVAWCCLVIFIVLLLVSEWLGERYLWTLILTYAPPVFWLVPATLLLLYTVWRRQGWGVALLAVLLAVWNAELLHWKPQQAGELRVMTFNVLSAKGKSASDLAVYLLKYDADIIFLQESLFTPAFRTKLENHLSEYHTAHAGDVTTFSKLPLKETFELPLVSSVLKRRTLVNQVYWNGPLTLVNTHLNTVQVIDLLAGEFKYMRVVMNRREQQVKQLEGIAKQVSGKMILAGDLNTPPKGRLYRRLEHAFGPNVHKQAGRGPGWTFPSLYLRIDHMMTRGLIATHSRVLPSFGSDHLPLLVDLKVRE